jgi:hypothetical protein
MFDEFGDPISEVSSGGDSSGFDNSGDVSGGDPGGGGFGGGSLIPAGLFTSVGPATSIRGGLMGNPGGLARRAGGVISTAMGRISTTKAWLLVKKFGPEVVGAAIGMAAGDLMSVLIHSGAVTRRARRRGISSRDIRCAKRVIRFTNRMVQDLGCINTPRHHARGVTRRARA